MRNWQLIRQTIANVLAGQQNRVKARESLGIPKPTWNRWLRLAITKGVEAVGDHRHSNYRKITNGDRQTIETAKRTGSWRSARHIRDQLGLLVHPKTIENVLKEAGLWHVNIERLKPVEGFVAKRSNDLWQTDIMGRMIFSKGTIFGSNETLWVAKPPGRCIG